MLLEAGAGGWRCLLAEDISLGRKIPTRAEYSVTENVTSPFHAEPEQFAPVSFLVEERPFRAAKRSF
jgi:hypothetical protein